MLKHALMLGNGIFANLKASKWIILSDFLDPTNGGIHGDTTSQSGVKNPENGLAHTFCAWKN